MQWYCIFEGLVEMCEVVGLELYWKLITKIMSVVCEVVAGFLHGVVFSGTEVSIEKISSTITIGPIWGW